MSAGDLVRDVRLLKAVDRSVCLVEAVQKLRATKLHSTYSKSI